MSVHSRAGWLGAWLSASKLLWTVSTSGPSATSNPSPRKMSSSSRRIWLTRCRRPIGSSGIAGERDVDAVLAAAAHRARRHPARRRGLRSAPPAPAGPRWPPCPPARAPAAAARARRAAAAAARPCGRAGESAASRARRRWSRRRSPSPLRPQLRDPFDHRRGHPSLGSVALVQGNRGGHRGVQRFRRHRYVHGAVAGRDHRVGQAVALGADTRWSRPQAARAAARRPAGPARSARRAAPRVRPPAPPARRRSRPSRRARLVGRRDPRNRDRSRPRRPRRPARRAAPRPRCRGRATPCR